MSGQALLVGAARRDTSEGSGPAGPARGAWRAPAAALAVYAALAVVAFWPILPLDNAHLPAAKLNDTISVAWFLDWVATALRHGHNPLFSTYLEHPVGVNLAVNQSMSLAGVLTAPVSWLLGPFAAFNLWMRLAFATSATSMYLVLRSRVRRELAAFVGGLLYGFSPFMVGHELISPDFSLAVVPPLVLALVDDLLRADRRSARRDGVLLGVCGAAQLYLNAELLAEVSLATVVAVVLLLPVVVRRDGIARLRRLVTGAAVAVAVGGLLGAPFAWWYLAGPEHLHGPVVPLHYLTVFRTDLAGLVVPGINERLGPARLVALGTSYTSYAINETGVYLGLPLLVLLGYLTVRLRHRRLVSLSSTLAVVGLVLSLGRSLVVDNHHTGVWLPGALLLHVPLLQSAEAIRFILVTYLGASIVLAVGLDELAGAISARRRSRGTVAVWVVSAIVLLPLVPRWPYAHQPTAIPAYFRDGTDRAIPAGSVAMTYPYAQPGQVAPEMWQMASGFRFRLVGGYAYVADDGGIPFGSPPVEPPALTDLLVAADTGGPLPPPDAATDAAIRSALRSTGVQVFLLQPVGERPRAVVAAVSAALGRRPVATGGILAWYHVRADLAREARVHQ